MPLKSTSASSTAKARPKPKAGGGGKGATSASSTAKARPKPKAGGGGKAAKQPAGRASAGAKAGKPKDMGWLIDLRSAKEALEAALAAAEAPQLAAAIEAGRTATATAPAGENAVFGEVLALLTRAGDELEVRRLASGGAWAIPVAWLRKALDRAVELGKTPLIVDNKAGVAASFLQYQSVVTIDGKGLVARKATKSATVEELREGCREKLVTAMTCGYPLVLHCGTAAPDFLGTFCGESFPDEVFATVHHDAFNGKDDSGYTGSAVNCAAFDERLAAGDDLRELQKARAVGRARGCHTIVLTAFDLEDYAEFLRFGEFLPARDAFQVIHFTSAD